MTRPETNGDLRKTNDRAAKRRNRLDGYRQRTQPTRDRVRRLALISAGLNRGWFGR